MTGGSIPHRMFGALQCGGVQEKQKIRAHSNSDLCTAFCTQKDQEKVEPRNGGLSREAASQDA